MTNKKYNSEKVNITLIGITALIAILLITWIAIDTNMVTNSNNDAYGQVSQAMTENINDRPLCRLIIGQNENYDSTNLLTGLQIDSNTYYLGHNIVVKELYANGCLVSVDEASEYIAVGQIQKVGQLYITIKNISYK
jgi:hypothetical protein